MTIFGTNTTFRAALVPAGFPIDDGEVTGYGVLLGSRDTAVGVVEGTLDQLIEYFEDVVTQLRAEAQRRARYQVNGPRPRRGAYRLPQDSVVDGVDHDALEISNSFGAQVVAYRRTQAEVAAAFAEVRIATLGAGSPLQYLVAWPGAQPGMPGDESAEWWRTFGTDADMRAWAAAYRIQVPDDPAPGEHFYLAFPQDDSAFQPLA